MATNVREALSGMFQSPSRPAGELGDLVRNASNHKGPWPKLSVWHGSADRTVNPANANEIVKQWLDVHRAAAAPMSEGTVDGYPRQVWWNADGETVVESYTITDMAHGTPLGIADNDERYGAEGAFLIEAGISSSYHIANFFGLTERHRSVRRKLPRKLQRKPPRKLQGKFQPKLQGSRRRNYPWPSRYSRGRLTSPRCSGRWRSLIASPASLAARRDRRRQRHHPRADGGGPDEIRTAASVQAAGGADAVGVRPLRMPRRFCHFVPFPEKKSEPNAGVEGLLRL